MSLTAGAVGQIGAAEGLGSRGRHPGRWSTIAWYLLVALPISPPWRPPTVPAGQRGAHRVIRLLVIALILAALHDPLSCYGAALGEGLVAVRTLPATALGAVWGLAHGGTIGVRGPLLVIGGMHGGHGAGSGITIGSVMLARDRPDQLSTPLVRHESHHRRQWGLWGPGLFPLLYGAAQIVATHVLHAGTAGNVFEIAAGLHDGGYPVPRGRYVADLVHLFAPAGPSNPGRIPGPVPAPVRLEPPRYLLAVLERD